VWKVTSTKLICSPDFAQRTPGNPKSKSPNKTHNKTNYVARTSRSERWETCNQNTRIKSITKPKPESQKFWFNITMVNYRRNFLDGGTYFFTVNLHNRKKSLLTENIDNLRNAFSRTKELHPFTINAICILPEHLHALITLPENENNFSIHWQLIKRYFTSGFRNRDTHNAFKKIWQDRFWEHTIVNQADYNSHVNYIHFNPVKHGHIDCVNRWPYSSFHNFVKRRVLPLDWGSGYVELGGGVLGSEFIPAFATRSPGYVIVRNRVS